MKPILLAAVALPAVLLTGCATDVGFYDSGPGYYGPGYYAYDDGYYGGPYIGVYGYDRGYYYHHYDRDSHNTAFARSNTRVNTSRTAVASTTRSSSHTHASRSASVSSGVSHERR